MGISDEFNRVYWEYITIIGKYFAGGIYSYTVI